MKTMGDLSLNDEGVIVKVDADEELQLRLFSFGIHKGTKFIIKNLSIAKSTIEVEAGRTLIALRLDEAKKIKIEEVA